MLHPEPHRFPDGVADVCALRRLLQTPAGRGHFLNIAAEAEDCDDGQVFHSILRLQPAPELCPMIRRHHDDEKHHAELLRACVIRNGVTPYPVPPERQLFIRLTEAVGGMPATIWGAYALVQVAEERSMAQYSYLTPILREVDPESADVVATIARDEVRHIRYCETISRRYAPSADVLAATLAEFCAVEARVFRDFTRAVMGG